LPGTKATLSTKTFEHGDVIYKSELSEREAEIARVLTSRGVLQRFSDGDKGIYYSKNINTGVEKWMT
jgi:hypothetical protein